MRARPPKAAAAQETRSGSCRHGMRLSADAFLYIAPRIGLALRKTRLGPRICEFGLPRRETRLNIHEQFNYFFRCCASARLMAKCARRVSGDTGCNLIGTFLCFVLVMQWFVLFTSYQALLARVPMKSVPLSHCKVNFFFYFFQHL